MGINIVACLDNALFREVVTNCSQGLLVVEVSSEDSRIVYANPAYLALSGHAADELDGASWLDQVVADPDSTELVTLRRELAGGASSTLCLSLKRSDGEIWIGRFRLTPLADTLAQGRLCLVEHVVDDQLATDGTELLRRALGRARRTIASLDRTDAVTGLLSPAEFKLLLRRDIAVARRNEQALHLMLFSVPEFAVYRKTFGSNAADSCLRMIGAQIAGTFRRAGDLSARLDDSLFAVAVVDQDDPTADRLFDKVRTKIRNLGLHNPRAQMSKYVVVEGVVVAGDPESDDVESLLARADAAFAAGNAAPARAESA